MAEDEQSVSRKSATINPAKSMDIGPKKDVAYAAKLFLPPCTLINAARASVL